MHTMASQLPHNVSVAQCATARQVTVWNLSRHESWNPRKICVLTPINLTPARRMQRCPDGGGILVRFDGCKVPYFSSCPAAFTARLAVQLSLLRFVGLLVSSGSAASKNGCKRLILRKLKRVFLNFSVPSRPACLQKTGGSEFGKDGRAIVLGARPLNLRATAS